MSESFSSRLLAWFDREGRKDLPWQQDDDPYRIWLSEVMLQQTQVARVIPYFQQFVERFPTVTGLAAAELDEVLHLWSGLGYYARGRNLHAAAKKVVAEFGGVFPADQDGLESLPGVGRSTAGAIRAQAFGQCAPILDGNAKRVLSRYFGLREWPGTGSAQKTLWEKSSQLLPRRRLRDYTQAIMDLGATLCLPVRPRCGACPFSADCIANHDSMQAEIPAPRPKTKRSVRDTVFLMAINDRGEILLEKRPPTGIWGSLWSFPEVDLNTLDEDLARFGLQSKTERNWLPAGSHRFTHFTLNYRPLVVRVDASSIREVCDSDQRIWYSSSFGSEIGVAAPVTKILEAYWDIMHDQNRFLPQVPAGDGRPGCAAHARCPGSGHLRDHIQTGVAGVDDPADHADQ